MTLFDKCIHNKTCSTVSPFENSCGQYAEQDYISMVAYNLSMQINNDIEDFIVRSVEDCASFNEQITVNAKKIYEAVKKQIPKKPLSNNQGYAFRCPKCNAFIVQVLSGEKINYCTRCGQAIDWTEDNECL